MRTQRGFTLIELIVTISILAVLVSMAVPSMGQFMDKRRVIDAGEAIYSQLQYARSEAISRSTQVSVVINDTSTPWAIGVSNNVACDPTIADPADTDACTLDVGGTPVLHRIVGSDFPQVNFESNTGNVNFDPRRGTAGGAGTIKVSFAGFQLDIVISPIGRVRMCSPSASVPGYKEC